MAIDLQLLHSCLQLASLDNNRTEHMVIDTSIEAFSNKHNKRHHKVSDNHVAIHHTTWLQGFLFVRRIPSSPLANEGMHTQYRNTSRQHSGIN